MAFDANEAIQILTLVNALEPAGIALVKDLATKLQGKSDAEIIASANAIDDQGIADANTEIAALPPQG